MTFSRYLIRTGDWEGWVSIGLGDGPSPVKHPVIILINGGLFLMGANFSPVCERSSIWDQFQIGTMFDMFPNLILANLVHWVSWC